MQREVMAEALHGVRPARSREEWLAEAVRAMDAEVLAKHPHGRMPAEWRVSVGEPQRKVIGRAWTGGHIFVMATLEEPVQVLGVLLHEMIHQAVGLKHKHKGPFAQLARAVGLQGRLTATHVAEGSELHEYLSKLAMRLGPYDHKAMACTRRAGSGGGGWLRYQSPTNPSYRILISPVQLMEHGPPNDPWGHEMEPAT